MSYLRDYQIRGRDATTEALANGSSSTLLVMPTGTGKTELALDVIDNWPDKCNVLCLSHLQELVHQPWGRWERKTGDHADIIQAENRRSTTGKSLIAFASKDSLYPERLKSEYPDPKRVGLIWVDEAHHCVSSAKSYKHIIDYFMNSNPDCRMFGTTATPDRADETALGTMFDSVAFEYPMYLQDAESAISDGWLVMPDQQFIVVEDLKFESVKTRGGDFIDSSLAKEINKHVEKIAAATRQYADGRQTLCFLPAIEQAIHSALIYNAEQAHSAYAIASRVPKDADPDMVVRSNDSERRKTLFRMFTHNRFQYLCNVGIVTEGTDVPSVSCVSMGRPTQSRALYTQMTGRVLRILPGIIEGQNVDGTYWRIDDKEERLERIAMSAKPSALILDFVGNSRHSLVSMADILGGQYPDDVVEEAKNRARTGKQPNVAEALREAAADKAALERRRRVKALASTRAKAVNPFDVMDCPPRREPGWHKGRKPTEKMKQALLKFKVDASHVDEMSFCQASGLLDRLIAGIREDKATYRQRAVLMKHNFDPDVSFQEARQTLDRIAASKWTLKGDYVR